MKINKNLNYYSILDLEFNFEPNELKNNYRSLSKTFHPDKNGGDDKHFKLINEAYKVLSNIELRNKYDRESKYGHSYDPLLELLEFEFSNSNVSTTRVMDSMDKFKKNDMIHIVIELSEFKENLEYTRDIICSKCEGSGNSSIMDVNLHAVTDGNPTGPLFSSDEEIECDICNRTGTYNDRECPACKGEGYIKLGFGKCKDCDGRGLKESVKKIKLRKESFEDNKMKIDYYGNQSKHNGIVGNLYIIIKED